MVLQRLGRSPWLRIPLQSLLSINLHQPTIHWSHQPLIRHPKQGDCSDHEPSRATCWLIYISNFLMYPSRKSGIVANLNTSVAKELLWSPGVLGHDWKSRWSREECDWLDGISPISHTKQPLFCGVFMCHLFMTLHYETSDVERLLLLVEFGRWRWEKGATFQFCTRLGLC